MHVHAAPGSTTIIHRPSFPHNHNPTNSSPQKQYCGLFSFLFGSLTHLCFSSTSATPTLHEGLTALRASIRAAYLRLRRLRLHNPTAKTLGPGPDSTPAATVDLGPGGGAGGSSRHPSFPLHPPMPIPDPAAIYAEHPRPPLPSIREVGNELDDPYEGDGAEHSPWRRAAHDTPQAGEQRRRPETYIQGRDYDSYTSPVRRFVVGAQSGGAWPATVLSPPPHGSMRVSVGCMGSPGPTGGRETMLGTPTKEQEHPDFEA